jgi:uncharacterized surface protein with fasciclin (FAS1) repeats
MNKYSLILSFVITFLFFGCENPWNEHVKVNDNVLQESIGDYLSSESQFSIFVELLSSTGMDNVLSSSVIYTVWAPTNDAMAAVDQSLLSTDAKKKLFVQNHIAFGNYSSKDGDEAIRLTMRSEKVLDYDAANATIDGVDIDPDQEKEVKNGTIQVIGTALSPRYSIWEYIELGAPDCEFVSFLNSLTKSVFDEESSSQVGVNSNGQPIYDTVWVVENSFLNYVDISSEDLLVTLIIPSDDVFKSEFSKYEKYYRLEDRRNNEVPSAKDSVYIKLMIARDMVLAGKYSVGEASDTMLSCYNVKVPFVKSAVTSSYEASNGYIHFSNNCFVKITDKVKPILIEAENYVYSTYMDAGSPCPYFRLRDDASNGMDFICDNSNSSQILSGVVFEGPVVASIKYRIKIRAINDFGKSYRNSDTSVVLIQKLGTVTIVRDSETNEITTISKVTNSLNYTNKTYGTPDVTSDTIFVTSKEYSPIDQAEDDEIDLGYYDFNKSDNVFLRLIPLSKKMAVTADYFRLVPIIEE